MINISSGSASEDQDLQRSERVSCRYDTLEMKTVQVIKQNKETIYVAKDATGIF